MSHAANEPDNRLTAGSSEVPALDIAAILRRGVAWSAGGSRSGIDVGRADVDQDAAISRPRSRSCGVAEPRVNSICLIHRK